MWLLLLAGVVVLLTVIAWWPNLRGRRRGAPDGPGEQVLREADRGFGMISGWKNSGGFGGGFGDGGAS